MAYKDLQSIKSVTDGFITDRLNIARIEIINFLQDTLHYVDSSIYCDARNYLYKKQLEIMATRGDIDVKDFVESLDFPMTPQCSIQSMPSDCEQEEEKHSFNDIEEDIDDDKPEDKLEDKPEDKPEDKKLSFYESSDDETEEIEKKSKQTVDTYLIEKVNAVKKEIEQKILDKQYILVCKNKTYLEAIMKDIDCPQQQPSTPQVTQQQPSTPQVMPKSAYVRSRPLNPSVFRTNNGTRLEIPILDPGQIHPFADYISEYYDIHPSFDEFKTNVANTRFKAMIEAMKYFNTEQRLIDYILAN